MEELSLCRAECHLRRSVSTTQAVRADVDHQEASSCSVVMPQDSCHKPQIGGCIFLYPATQLSSVADDYARPMRVDPSPEDAPSDEMTLPCHWLARARDRTKTSRNGRGKYPSRLSPIGVGVGGNLWCVNPRVKLACERKWGQVRQRARSRGSCGEGSGPSPRGRNAKMRTGGSVPGQLWGGVGA